MEKGTTAEYIYRCRNCKKVHVGCEGGVNADRPPIYSLIDAIHRIVVRNQPPVPMLETHLCSKTKGGISDLIGYRII